MHTVRIDEWDQNRGNVLQESFSLRKLQCLWSLRLLWRPLAEVDWTSPTSVFEIIKWVRMRANIGCAVNYIVTFPSDHPCLKYGPKSRPILCLGVGDDSADKDWYPAIARRLSKIDVCFTSPSWRLVFDDNDATLCILYSPPDCGITGLSSRWCLMTSFHEACEEEYADIDCDWKRLFSTGKLSRRGSKSSNWSNSSDISQRFKLNEVSAISWVNQRFVAYARLIIEMRVRLLSRLSRSRRFCYTDLFFSTIYFFVVSKTFFLCVYTSVRVFCY